MGVRNEDGLPSPYIMWILCLKENSRGKCKILSVSHMVSHRVFSISKAATFIQTRQIPKFIRRDLSYGPLSKVGLVDLNVLHLIGKALGIFKGIFF